MAALTRTDIHRLFHRLDEALRKEDVIGEVYLVGGAVMCLVLKARPSTQDVDAWFVPKTKVREAASKVGTAEGVGPKWLNDAVKGYVAEHPSYDRYLELPNLRVFAAQPEYLLAMKCLAMRIGAEFHDEEDIRYLLRCLNIETYDQALNIITRYYPADRFPQKTFYALAEILNKTQRPQF